MFDPNLVQNDFLYRYRGSTIVSSGGIADKINFSKIPTYDEDMKQITIQSSKYTSTD
jgi:hypothetical protein